MAALTDLDIPSEITLYQIPLFPKVDEALIQLNQVLEIAKRALYQSTEASIDFGTLLEKSSELTSPALKNLAKVLQGTNEALFILKTSEPQIETEERFSEMTALALIATLAEEMVIPLHPDEIENIEKRDIRKLWCYEYALLRAGEKRIFEVEYEDQYNIGDIPALLKKWNYHSVEKPEIGDLVLYLKDLEPTHLAIYRGAQKVESKWWNTIPTPFLHNIQTVPSNFGNQIVFYRPIKDPQKVYL